MIPAASARPVRDNPVVNPEATQTDVNGWPELSEDELDDVAPDQ